MRKSHIFVVIVVVLMPMSGCIENTEAEDEIKIRWTNVDECDFSIVLDSGDGRMYSEWVDYADAVWWTPEDKINGPFTFTLTNLESYKKCYTIQTLVVYGEEKQESTWVQPNGESRITIS